MKFEIRANFLLAKILIWMLKNIDRNIYIPSIRLGRIIQINPSREPHDLRQIFIPDFQKVNNQTLGRLVYVGASAGVNILNLSSCNEIEEIYAIEVNKEDENSLLFNLRNFNSKIFMHGISKDGGRVSFTNASRLAGSLFTGGTDIRDEPMQTIGVEQFYKEYINDTTTLVLNCNGTEQSILENMSQRDVKPRLLLVYFFNHLCGYDKEKIMHELTPYYRYVFEDGPYTVLARL